MKNAPPDISIIIPTFNEAGTLESTIRAARSDQCSIEWIVVDGGSKDSTTTVATNEGCLVIMADRAQRAHQLNLGAQKAGAGILLFLHADTRLPKHGAGQVLDLMTNNEIAGGGFLRVFESTSRILRITCRLAAWRSSRLGVFLGDQGMFVRHGIFDELQGFDEKLEFAEDLDFSLRLRRKGKVAAIPGPSVSSARRFEKNGPLRQSLIDFWLTLKFVITR